MKALIEKLGELSTLCGDTHMLADLGDPKYLDMLSEVVAMRNRVLVIAKECHAEIDRQGFKHSGIQPMPEPLTQLFEEQQP